MLFHAVPSQRLGRVCSRGHTLVGQRTGDVDNVAIGDAKDVVLVIAEIAQALFDPERGQPSQRECASALSDTRLLDIGVGLGQLPGLLLDPDLHRGGVLRQRSSALYGPRPCRRTL